ncbi:hypothetical protein E4U30_001197 [Claviceps sp. LM220 group G6]|nr:hypothetical protein E4U30_001197 [Claviceps sp. LM220 group G6]
MPAAAKATNNVERDARFHFRQLAIANASLRGYDVIRLVSTHTEWERKLNHMMAYDGVRDRAAYGRHNHA